MQLQHVAEGGQYLNEQRFPAGHEDWAPGMGSMRTHRPSAPAPRALRAPPYATAAANS